MDFYCERTNEYFFDEPINTVSNIFFIIVSFIIFRKLKNHQAKKMNYSYPILIFLIGVGSFLFHLKPSKITLMMDVIPILMFSLFFIFEINRVWLKLNLHINLFFLITFFCLFFFISPNLDYEFLNGSEFYIANYLFLLMYSFIFYLKKSDAFSLMLTSFLIFNLSIFFRSIDNNICHSLSIGTHFLWHFFNAILLKNLTYLNCKIIQKKI